ncbi:uncharacterized protein LACBIDRAFT_293223 [Laccaria bicolor S238N-H82]|uniref:Predicted protein n=1 Tax=Laccaria bicolor (strain S238N-H82 / ATCC MYA-4686) TaxID=486041 RepID=B0D1L1_LACBS|nr:uncharacterized protein LACBIDRAFT_293223 [Laccaria bicolor S238N-H82]EDR11659.1 predicted protein [Laccaria bicolor S238N-H82]|eukprot:XP_001877556.1 predicted protein [Laccaria bicolor S238N-H82]
MHQKAEFKPGLFLLAWGITFISLVVRPSAYRGWLFIPILSICLYLAFYTTPGDVANGSGLACFVVSLIFYSLDLTVLTDVQNELRLVGQKTSISAASLSDRFWWALRLLSSPRGIGWVHEPTTHILPHPTTSRVRFLWDQILRTAKFIIIFDVVRVLSYSNPYFQKGGPSLTDAGLLWRLTVLAQVITVYASMARVYTIYSIVSVGLGLTVPGDWPPLFGYLGDAYTVRRSWGRVWHQLMRRFLQVNSDFLAYKVLRLPRKSTFTTYFKLFVAFFISGLIHHIGDYAALGQWHGSLAFFVYQAVVITFEDAVIAIAAKFGFDEPTPLKKFFGYLWVAAWLIYSMPMWSGPQMTGGFMEDDAEFSPIMGLSRGEWYPKPDPVNVLSTALSKIFYK